ncbi:response regulator [Oscillatoria sp. CS-180]|uniref:hybrid sensor histidine kinase/response regulator n=1 Tax=Oscillatoria sp. CS-180 TaxID=3021720 RepID=UPI00232F0B05|nr:response regulator [Oscillatoria sp. CS-180]MDB9529111.1 response regulator [Oscillatoria sp. CS-180]
MFLSAIAQSQTQQPVRTPRILILEDDPIDLELIEATLRSGNVQSDTVGVRNRKTFLEQLNSESFDLILADYIVPEFTGNLALELAKEVCPEVPFIIVSGVMGEEQAIESLKLGATDYVLKQRIGRLVPSVKRALREREERYERGKVAQALRETDDLLRAIVDASPIGILTLTRQQRVMTWNTAAELLYGHSAETLVDHLLPVISDSERAEFDRCFDQVLANQTVSNREFQHIKDDGEQVDVSVSLAPLQDDNGYVYSVVMTATDITVRKQIEAQRLALLQQESSAREAAESANRIKDEFLAVLSHELRTPLNAIVGWIQLIQRGDLKPETFQRALDTIERNATAQTQLIEDLLDLSRIVRGQVSLNIQPVNVAELIQSTVESLRPATSAKSIQIDLDLAPNVGEILADPNRLQQVFWNLLSNAIKFTPVSKQITVHMSVVETQLQVQVIDSGIGISADFLPYVFEHFRQADGSSKRSQGGLGLGLAISRRLVELHGGTIHASSPGLGQGATFMVQLPMRFEEQDTEASQSTSEGEVSLAGVKVMVVDDEADARELLTIILDQWGADVESFSSVAAACQQLERAQPDIVVSDIAMPDEDGYCFIERIRSLPNKTLSTIPAIALTAYAREEDRQHALAVGYSAHLSKPYDSLDVVNTINRLLYKTS